MPKDDDNSIWFEVLQRLTKIETNTEGLNEISGIARSALAKSEENAKDIEEIKEISNSYEESAIIIAEAATSSTSKMVEVADKLSKLTILGGDKK